MVFETTDMDLQVSFDDKLQLVSSGIVYDADALAQGTISGEYVSDKVTSVKDYAFAECANLTSISLPNCTSVSAYAFRTCEALESANLPNCVSFVKARDRGGWYFAEAVKLKTINIPNLITIQDGTRAFAGCVSLEEFNAPNLTSIGSTSTMFSQCTKVMKISFPKLGGTTINANTFNICYALKTLILGGSEFCPLDNINAFSKAGQNVEGGFKVYVPDNLVDTYKTATNWSNFADKIKPISELEE